ncbi:DnaJ C-terminal domain-containing protein [Actinomyces vulturis]|uniref:DnaJ C-terminal domain-containing protein n=1 Tax=Actinomyces vulturis TaxID=1857645 RepID=UPI000835617E|nr:DnaJ C-terminal domain-containing protein [Actinomyces vulturis]
MASQEWMTKDFYATLDVAKDADEATIKKAYRKLAKKYHPDRNPGDENAAEKFKEIGEAYAVLSDPKDRKQYDAIRSMSGGGARFAGSGGGAGFEDVFSNIFGGGGFGSDGGVRFSTSGSQADIDLDDLLAAFGGTPSPTRKNGRPGAFNFGGFGSPEPVKGQDVLARATITFDEAVSGATIELTADGRTIKTRIPAGVHDGQKIRLRGKGRPGNYGGENGDMVITVKVKPHPVYSIDGKNLRMTLPITLAEAALGAVVEVPLWTGGTSKIKIAPGTQSGTIQRLRGKGITTSKGTSDMLVELEVAVPKKLSDDARKALEEFEKAMEGSNPRAHLMEEAAQ